MGVTTFVLHVGSTKTLNLLRILLRLWVVSILIRLPNLIVLLLFDEFIISLFNDYHARFPFLVLGFELLYLGFPEQVAIAELLHRSRLKFKSGRLRLDLDVFVVNKLLHIFYLYGLLLEDLLQGVIFLLEFIDLHNLLFILLQILGSLVSLSLQGPPWHYTLPTVAHQIHGIFLHCSFQISCLLSRLLDLTLFIFKVSCKQVDMALKSLQNFIDVTLVCQQYVIFLFEVINKRFLIMNQLLLPFILRINIITNLDQLLEMHMRITDLH